MNPIADSTDVEMEIEFTGSKTVAAFTDMLSRAKRPSDNTSLPQAGSQVDSPLFAEDLALGDCWVTELREISESDVHNFASLTGDHTPLHDEDGAVSPYGKPIAHGLLGLSVLAGLGTKHPYASTLAFLAVENWQFLAPVFFGDKVQARILQAQLGENYFLIEKVKNLQNYQGIQVRMPQDIVIK